MSKQKLVRFKQNELHRLHQLVESIDSILARKIKGYMGMNADKLGKIESHRLAQQENEKVLFIFGESTIEGDTLESGPFERVPG